MPTTSLVGNVQPADFRSDTVTRPSDAMRACMASAEVGDDVLDGDPTVTRLEERGAAWLGKQAAIYVPSGTMANQVALGAWTRPGDEIIVQRWAHITTFESGAVGALHGLQSLNVGGASGSMDPEEVRAALRPAYIHCPKSALICMEQTHNVAGGRVIPLEEMRAIRQVALEAEVPVHLDGARLANAVAASGVEASVWTEMADSVSMCLSKGLGAPVGSLIAGDTAFIERARLMRKRFGGWMRQAGIIAAAGLYALENNVARLADDHRLARQVATTVAAFDGLSVDVEGTETNIVLVQIERPDFDAASLAAALAEHDVLGLPMAARTLRLMTHLDVGPADLERLDAAFHAVLD
ncbi:MAG: threonine aldolase [Chlamydiales bacterium]|jgi:threonine aldolase